MSETFKSRENLKHFDSKKLPNWYFFSQKQTSALETMNGPQSTACSFVGWFLKNTQNEEFSRISPQMSMQHFVAHSSFQGRRFVSVKKCRLFGKLFERKCFKFSLKCTGYTMSETFKSRKNFDFLAHFLSENVSNFYEI